MKIAKQAILVTGGGGYIGSHVVHALRCAGERVVVLDDQRQPQSPALADTASIVVGSCGDRVLLDRLFVRERFKTVIHCAASIEVGASVTDPLGYYSNNVAATLTLLDAMRVHGVNQFIFSSSAAVYGTPVVSPISEQCVSLPINPYGQSKLMIEQVLRDYQRAYGLRWLVFRYFNVAGADYAAGLGECHQPETHVIPLLLRAAVTQQPFFIFGADYPTPDGSCLRDYVHVKDVAQAHVCGIGHLQRGLPNDTFNIASGHGTSVRELISAVEQLLDTRVIVHERSRRAGDPAQLVADVSKAHDILDWRLSHSDLCVIVRSALAFDRFFTVQKG